MSVDTNTGVRHKYVIYLPSTTKTLIAAVYTLNSGLK